MFPPNARARPKYLRRNKTKLPHMTLTHYVGALQVSVTEVYVDGACKGNGQRDCVGGYGGYYGPGDARNFALPLPETEAQTNNRAEMRAVLEVLRRTEPGLALLIHTDSIYVLKGLTEWLPGWKARGWRSSTGAPVLNRDLWEALDAARQGRGASMELRHVKGHSGVPGNEAADALAVQGALMAREARALRK